MQRSGEVNRKLRHKIGTKIFYIKIMRGIFINIATKRQLLLELAIYTAFHPMPQSVDSSSATVSFLGEPPKVIRWVQKKSKLLLAATALTCIGVSATLLYFRTQQIRVYSPLESGKLVPDEALMATFVSPTPEVLKQLQNFGTSETQNMIRQGVQVFQKHSLAGIDLDFNQDLKPWIGGVMVAMLPSDKHPSNSDPQLLMIVGIKDKWKAGNFAKKFNNSPQIKRESNYYRGIEISNYLEKSGRKYSVAVINEQVVIAATPEPVQQAIDTFLGEPSLASLAGTPQQFFESVKVANPLVTIFIADYAHFTEDLLATVPEASGFSLNTLSQLKPIQSLVIGVGVEREGLRFKVVSELNPNGINAQNPPELGKMLTRFPTETVALVNSQNLHQLWLELLTVAENNYNVQNGVNQIRQGLQAINLDADTEVFGWMDGEFAIGAIASEEGILSSLGLGGVLMIETSDRPSAEAMMDKLDRIIARSNPPIHVEEQTLAGVNVTEWNDPKQGTLFGHGWLSPNVMFVAFGGPVVQVVTQEPQQPLPESQRFQQITESLPDPNHSYVYLDMEKITAWARGYLLAAPAMALQPNLMTVLNSVRGVGISSHFRDQSTAEVEMLLILKPKS